MAFLSPGATRKQEVEAQGLCGLRPVNMGMVNGRRLLGQSGQMGAQMASWESHLERMGVTQGEKRTFQVILGPMLRWLFWLVFRSLPA